MKVEDARKELDVGEPERDGCLEDLMMVMLNLNFSQIANNTIDNSIMKL